MRTIYKINGAGLVAELMEHCNIVAQKRLLKNVV